MNRIWRLSLVAMLLAGSINIATLALPGRAFACSCRITGPADLVEIANEPGMVVFVGTVVAMPNIPDGAGHLRGVLEFQHVYRGTVPAARMPVLSGGGGDCTMSLSAGQRMVTVAPIEEGVLTPGLCLPFGDPETPDGQALIQAAIAAFGAGSIPPGATPEENPQPTAGDTLLPIILGTTIVATAALFGTVALFSRRPRAA